VNVDWLLTTQGRLARIALGTALILFGLGVVKGFFGVLLLLIGAVPIASAAYGTLLIGPLFGRDIHGRRPEEQPKEEPQDAAEEGDDDAADDDAADDDSADDDTSAAPKADPDWKAPPLATAEREPGREPRTRDLRADED
jgi:Inner membrane protein YgaP-like, transmembrane domain